MTAQHKTVSSTGSKSATGLTVTGGSKTSDPGSRTVISTSRPAAAAPPADLGRAIAGRYEVTGSAGSGGMGEVLIVRDRVLERDVALKRLADQDADEERVRRFVQEARVTGSLEHPGIVPVHDLGEENGRPVFTMKLVRGDSLGQVLRKLRDGDRPAAAQYTTRRLAGVLVAVCQAVAFAHAKGVLHRDLKPDNIMLGGFGEVLVMDWGLARLSGQAEGSAVPVSLTRKPAEGTMEGSIAGTPGYMSPEQARGEISKLTPASDVYALGAILYECLALTPPHHKENSLLTLRAAQTEPVVAPSRRAPGRQVPRDLEAVAMKALASEPGARYPSVDALRQDLQRWLDAEPVSARRIGPGERFALWMRRNRQLALGLGLGLGVAVTGAGGMWARDAWLESRDKAAREATVAALLDEAERQVQAPEPQEERARPAPAQLEIGTQGVAADELSAEADGGGAPKKENKVAISAPAAAGRAKERRAEKPAPAGLPSLRADREASRRLYERVLAMKPDDARARSSLARLFLAEAKELAAKPGMAEQAAALTRRAEALGK